MTVGLATAPVTAERTATTEELAPFATRGVGIVAACFVALELALSARYGFHRDELYFLACARHLSWGYVDQPPFVPAVAWVASHVLGTSPWSIRLLPALAGGAMVALAGATARELGGARRAQTLAALAAATSPQFLAMFHLLSTAAFDCFFWSLATFVVVRLLRTEDERLWVAFGAVVGVGLLNKWNIGSLVFGLVVGFLLGGRRRLLASRWALAGAGIAVLLWAPNLFWKAGHSWAEVAMTRQLHAENAGVGAVVGFIPSQVFVVGPVLVVFWVAGLRHFLRTRRWRPIGVAYVALLAAFTLSGAKSYYLAGMYPVLFAAGGVWAERRLAARVPARGLRGWVALMVAGAVVALPLALPVLPASALPRGSWEGSVNKDLSATVGWPQFVHQVSGIAAELPRADRSRLVVLTGDYGAAGAIDLWGPGEGLPHAISGHNSYWWWGYGDARNDSTTIAVDMPGSFLRTIFGSCRLAATAATPDGVWTEERGDPFFVCHDQKVSWANAWPSVRHYG